MLNTTYPKIIGAVMVLIALFYSFYISIFTGLLIWSIFTALRYNSLLPKKDLKNMHVMITGGGMGIGQELAFQLSKFGTKISIAELNLSLAEDTKKQLNAKGFKEVQVFQCDVSNPDTVNEVFQKSQSTYGDIDILINNAGIVSGSPFMECDQKFMGKVVSVNTIAHIYTTYNVLKSMIKRDKGHIVTVSSAAGYLPGANLIDYNTSKYGALGFHESLTMELQSLQSNVKTTIICPWFVHTQMAQDVDDQPLFPKLKLDETVARIVDGIRQDEFFVVIPWRVNIIIFIKQILPFSWFTALLEKSSIENLKKYKENKLKREQKSK